MAEAEDVITDAARHATIYARELWLRKRGKARNEVPPIILAQAAPRLDLLVNAVFGQSHPLRVAHPPAIPTLLTRWFRRHDVMPSTAPVPATDGSSIWLPNTVGAGNHKLAMERFRVMALLQAMRVQRGSALLTDGIATPRIHAIYLLLEAYASDQVLAALLPGIAPAINGLRLECLAGRPAVTRLPQGCQPIEQWVRAILRCPVGQAVADIPLCPTPSASLSTAMEMALSLKEHDSAQAREPHAQALYKDSWTGDLLPPADNSDGAEHATAPSDDQPSSAQPPRSARMPRRPKERKTNEDEDDDKQGVWMVQTNAPMEKAEDPMGMQRPADRDEQTAAEEFADALSELPEARLVSTPGKPREVLLSDDPPDKRSQAGAPPQAPEAQWRYPEWDYRIDGYRHPGATVRMQALEPGPQAWVDATLKRHQTMLDTLRKRFEMLRAERVWQRRQLDGDDIDLDACTEALADTRAGLPMPQALYKQQRPQRRDMAIMLLIDISGSTDSWLSANRRIIDVEREALLLVAIALERLGEPCSIQAFSGEGPQSVTVNAIKDFKEPYGNDIAQRIAALEPQHYTRAGAALRHASALLMQQPARHRLLLLLSDGKPNDVDQYEGRYGVEDMRRAVEEAKQQGIFPFCLTIDRQAAGYLPSIFGTRQYALLGRPEMLPTVLLDWMRRLISH
ncbi:nitric oxide reductase activation protein NorD [Pollutimonas sp. M17]|uniref:nitric oxide reductase activation protein NorD n=1 Tax=Pollutimonas sp. M17 TaxID=2962065 RepID=UPI0021F3E47B|nr:VWA domain-containing protein [Pollutimonas sp. M17]UYO93133.1 VWA domain-containing protein [Pollutimonas sp. M17]